MRQTRHTETIPHPPPQKDTARIFRRKGAGAGMAKMGGNGGFFRTAGDFFLASLAKRAFFGL
ncbi:MAG: hypothetical protein ACR2P4_10850 [Gammaproteobacteria bacterium]